MLHPDVIARVLLLHLRFDYEVVLNLPSALDLALLGELTVVLLFAEKMGYHDLLPDALDVRHLPKASLVSCALYTM